MARDNRLWGAERIRGELLKLGIRVCKRTIQKYMRQVRITRPRGQTWSTFLHTHAQQIWACDFLPVTDLFFHSLFVFFNTLLHSRRVIHVGVTRSPTDAWTAQQLREATAYGAGPKYLIRDNDGKFGVTFVRVAKTSCIQILTTPYHAPRANAICERFLGSVRRECLDHLLILHEKQLHRVLNSYAHYFNRARPHQGIQQQRPEPPTKPLPPDPTGGTILSFPVLGGLHHDYRRSAYVLPNTMYCQRPAQSASPMIINMQILVIFGAPWNKQGRWMLSGTGVSGFKRTDFLPILTSCDSQGSNDNVIEEVKPIIFLAGYHM